MKLLPRAFGRAILRIVVFGILACLSVGCGWLEFGKTEEAALAGGAVGAGLGAIVGNQTGDAASGLAIGAVAGASAGALIGSSLESKERALAAQTQRMQENENELRDSKVLIQELRTIGLDLRSTYRGITINLPELFFESGSARLSSEAVRAVQNIAEALKNSGRRRISVEGHTDSLGTIAQNRDLSEQRAKNVAELLVRNGLSPYSVSSIGFGESRPIAANSSKEGRQRNRRVEIVIEQ